jgi:tetratricopeptide (TPR) repeat protein
MMPMLKWLVVVAMVVALGTPPAGASWAGANAAFAAADYRTAASELEEVIAERPDYAPGHHLLGLARLQLGLTEAAVASLARASELDPANPEYRLALGRAELAAAQYDRALQTLLAVDVGALPDNLRREASQVLASAASRSSRSASAATQLEAAVASYPDDGLLQFALGQARSAVGDQVGAFEAYSTASRLVPSSASAGRNAAIAALRIANTLAEGADRALWYGWGAELAERAATVSGSADDATLAGEAYLGAGDPARALLALDRAVAVDSPRPLALYLLGRAAAGIGDTDQALARLGVALEGSDDASLRRAIGYSLVQVQEQRQDFGAAERVALELGDAARASQLRRLAAAAADGQLDACFARWVKLQGIKEDNRRSEGTPVWAAIHADEARLLAECAASLGPSS